MKQSLSRSQLYSDVDEQLPNTNFLIGGIGDGMLEGPHPHLCWNPAPFPSGSSWSSRSWAKNVHRCLKARTLRLDPIWPLRLFTPLAFARTRVSTSWWITSPKALIHYPIDMAKGTRTGTNPRLHSKSLRATAAGLQRMLGESPI